MALLLAILGGCSGGVTPTETDCQRVFLTTCNHQVTCELAFDHQSCEDDMREQFICDFDRTRDEFGACHESEPSCLQSVAEECLAVLCASSLGCVETAPGDTAAEFQ